MANRKPIPRKVREAVYNLCNGHCAYCGKEIAYKDMQVDHYISHEMGRAIAASHDADVDSIDNYLPACRSCNYRKSALHIEKFRLNVSDLHNTLMWNNVTYRDAVRFGQVEPKPHIQEFYYEKIGVSIPAMEWDKELTDILHKRYFGEAESEGY